MSCENHTCSVKMLIFMQQKNSELNLKIIKSLKGTTISSRKIKFRNHF